MLNKMILKTIASIMVSVCLVETFENAAHAVGDNGNLGGGSSGGNAVS